MYKSDRLSAIENDSSVSYLGMHNFNEDIENITRLFDVLIKPRKEAEIKGNSTCFLNYSLESLIQYMYSSFT